MAPLPPHAPLWQKGSQLLGKIRTFYAKDAKGVPLISEQTALLCEILFTIFYIAPFYLSPTLRTSPINSRDAPTVIRARVRAVWLTCLACTVVTTYLLAFYGAATVWEVVRLLGLWPIDPLDIVKVLALVMVLFSGPLYENIIVDSDWRHWSPFSFKSAIFDSWIGYRNLIVAPISEEFVFRGLTIPLFMLAKTTPTRIVFLTPLVFGVAHIHHVYEYLQSHTPPGARFPPLKVWINGTVPRLFQFAYTSLFGFFAAFIFLRTGNLWAVIVAHSFCNWMGLPRIWGNVGQFETWTSAASTTGDGVVEQDYKRDDDSHVPGSPIKVGNSLINDSGDEDDETKATHASHQPLKNLGVGWSVLYYVLFFAGAYGFYLLLFPLTQSGNALARI